MKWLIRLGIPILVFGACVLGDIRLVQFLFSHLSETLPWLFWARLGIVIGVLWLTAGFVLVATVLSGAIAAAITED